MSAAAPRKGWCPGALRPMPTGDGLLVRLRLTAGELPAATATAIAALAAEHGNGGIDLTRRANLQLRGVSETSLPELTRALNDLGLLDESPEAEAVRNVMVSPLAGLDPNCADGRGIARALEERLRRDRALHGLPAKFLFAVDGGGRWPLGDTGADLTLWAGDTDQPWRVELARSNCASEPIEPSQVTDVLGRLASDFAATRLPRMSDLVRRDGPEAIFARANIAAAARRGRVDFECGRPEAGLIQLASRASIAVIGLPFGHIDASQLRHLAELSGSRAVLRLTPWRLLLVPVANRAAASNLLDAADALGLVVARGDARAQIEACTGAPGCSNATTHTREDAVRLSRLLTSGSASGGTRLHVSGCAKGCACSGPAEATLVARGGRYDLIVNGTTRDAPVRSGLAPSELEAAFAQLNGPR